jgi:hypothetical protein
MSGGPEEARCPVRGFVAKSLTWPFMASGRESVSAVPLPHGNHDGAIDHSIDQVRDGRSDDYNGFVGRSLSTKLGG